jgi:tetratricopeptide (TPR) repeat protein
MVSRERFLEICEQVRTLLEKAPLPEADDATAMDEYLQERAQQLPLLHQAEELITRALEDYPLHPYLLDWRGRIRSRMTDDEGRFTSLDDARGDLELAAEVAPDYLPPRVALANFLYVYIDDDEAAADFYAALTEETTQLLCRCAAGRVEALAAMGKVGEARSELRRWRTLFPEDPALRRASDELEPGTN